MNKKCYICDMPLDNENNFVIRLGDESFDLCEYDYKRSKKLFMHMDKRRKELQGKICCKNLGDNCEYDSAWFCKNPDCITPVITSTLAGAYPSGCPKIDKWNSKKEGAKNETD